MSSSSSTNMMNVLPDDILKHILSLLSTRDAFRTKFVCKSWVPLSELLDVLSIDIRRPCFRLNQCVEAAKRRGIEDLSINWPRGVSSPSIFYCKTLVVLRLQSITILSMVGFSIDLPLLKTLVLCNIMFSTLGDFMKLVYGCPKLEDLSTIYVMGKSGGSIKSTTYFEPSSNLIKATTSIVEFPRYYWHFPTLSELGRSLPNKQIKGFRLFENLIELRMYWYYRDTCDWSEIVKMLFICPKLKVLYIVKVMIKHNLTKTTKHDWKYPDHVPESVRSHLTTCSIINYEAAEADFRFAIYILKNARLVQDMTIHVHSSSNTMQRAQFVENLSSFPRTSPAFRLFSIA
uniref:Cyclin-like F-box; FBD n=1 Tax=Medicago truncatula TaxID=3880 RepID=A2Q6E5_MEDTR|nr:Cyclin-like F-box; FBD [Medicago truncatula]